MLYYIVMLRYVTVILCYIILSYVTLCYSYISDMNL